MARIAIVVGLHTSLTAKSIFPPIGPLYIISELKKRGYQPILFDCRREKLSHVYKAVLDYKMDVCLSAYADDKYKVRLFIRNLKRLSSELRVIVGGPEATVDPIFFLYAGADFVIRGEAERALPEVIDRLGQTHEYDGIASHLCEGRYQEGRLHQVKDLDALDWPARDQLRASDYLCTILTSRGCRYHCTFCYEGGGSGVRFRDLAAVIDELSSLRRSGSYGYFVILDDTFTDSPKRTDEFCTRKMANSSVQQMTWMAMGRANILAKNIGLVGEMKKAGLWKLQIGLESCSDIQLQAYQKQIDVDDVIKVVEACKRVALPVLEIGLIVGGPFETKNIQNKTKKTIARVVSAYPEGVRVHVSYLTPFNGTMIRRNPSQYGLRLIDPDFVTGDSLEYCFCETEELVKADIIRFHNEIIDVISNLSKPPLARMKKDSKLRKVSERDILDKQIRRRMDRSHRSGYLLPRRLPNRIEPKGASWNIGAFCLNEEEYSVYELCSGKLTIEEITDLSGGNSTAIIEKLKLNGLIGEERV